MVLPAWTATLLLSAVVLVAPPAAVGGGPIVVADDSSPDDQTPKRTPAAERRDAEEWLEPQGLTTSTRDALDHRPRDGRQRPSVGGGWDRFPAAPPPGVVSGRYRDEGRRGAHGDESGADAGTNPDYVRYPVDYLGQDATPLLEGASKGHPSLYAMRGGVFKADCDGPAQGAAFAFGAPAFAAQGRGGVLYPYAFTPAAVPPGPVGYIPEIHARGDQGKRHDDGERRVYHVETPAEDHNYVGDDNDRYRATNQGHYRGYHGDRYREEDARIQGPQRQHLRGDQRFPQISYHVRPVLPRGDRAPNYGDTGERGSNRGRPPIGEYHGSEGSNVSPRRYS